MRLRQAHALIATAAALEAAGIGIEMHPFDVDDDTAPHIATDHMAGFAECIDPDSGGHNARIYNIDIYPGPTDYSIAVYVTFGLGPAGAPLFSRAFGVAAKAEDSNTYDHGTTAIAELVVAAIRDHEKPFEVAYAQRVGQAPKEQ